MEWRKKANEFALAHPSEVSEEYNKLLARLYDGQNLT